jgi:CelD/BcsL family acetyltransferase involved in cellulose biosynthesis
MDFQIIDAAKDFEALREEWQALLKASGIASPFLTWEWLFTWWECYGEKDKSNRLAIVTAREDGELKAILPGYLKRRRLSPYPFPVLVFSFLGTEYESSDYTEIISAQWGSPQTAALLEFLLKANRGIDVLSLTNIWEERPFLAQLEEFCQPRGFGYRRRHHRGCPFIEISGTYDAYIDGLTERKHELGRKSRKMFGRFNAQVDYVRDASEIETAIDDLFSLHEMRFASKNADSKFQRNLRSEFHVRVSRRFLEADILRLFQMVVEGKPVASIYCFEFAEEIFAFQTGMDPEWKKHSPQFVLWSSIIKYAFDKGLRRFDFMRGTQAYKFDWTKTVRHIDVVDIGASAKGKAALLVRDLGEHGKEGFKKLVPESGWDFLKKLTHR